MRIYNFLDNDDAQVIAEKGPFRVAEWQRDLSVPYGGAIAEWNEQAASFAAYVTGKTAEEVSGIAVGERTQPADADLASSVTIAIGGFQELITKAAR